MNSLKRVILPVIITHCGISASPPNFRPAAYEPDQVRIEQTKSFLKYPVLNYSNDDWRRYRNAYYRLVEPVDREVGKVLDGLKRRGLASDTWGWMIRTPKFKYVLYPAGRYREQLFDMKRDRGEQMNLAVESRYKGILEQHRKLLKEWAKANRQSFLLKVIPED